MTYQFDETDYMTEAEREEVLNNIEGLNVNDNGRARIPLMSQLLVTGWKIEDVATLMDLTPKDISVLEIIADNNGLTYVPPVDETKEAENEEVQSAEDSNSSESGSVSDESGSEVAAEEPDKHIIIDSEADSTPAPEVEATTETQEAPAENSSATDETPAPEAAEDNSEAGAE